MSTVKYIIPTPLFTCSFKLYLEIYSWGESNLGKELVHWILLKGGCAVGHFALFRRLHEVKWSKTSWHTLCFLSPLIYITARTILIFSSSHTKPHHGRPQTLKAFWEKFITTDTLASPSLVIIALCKLTYIWLTCIGLCLQFLSSVHLFNKYIDCWLGARHCFKCWVIAAEKEEFSLLPILHLNERQTINKW